eukprot:scaffold109745_cov66-Phaeocystis_antarctica.AAC.3
MRCEEVGLALVLCVLVLVPLHLKDASGFGSEVGLRLIVRIHLLADHFRSSDRRQFCLFTIAGAVAGQPCVRHSITARPVPRRSF